MIRIAAVFSLLLALPSVAEEVSLGTGAVLRGLDKVNGETTDMEIPNGGEAVFGDLRVSLGECRYPVGNPSGDAYAFVTVQGIGKDAPMFRGWMMASAPALNALDHARYDVWPLRCNTPAAE